MFWFFIFGRGKYTDCRHRRAQLRFGLKSINIGFGALFSLGMLMKSKLNILGAPMDVILRSIWAEHLQIPSMQKIHLISKILVRSTQTGSTSSCFVGCTEPTAMVLLVIAVVSYQYWIYFESFSQQIFRFHCIPLLPKPEQICDLEWVGEMKIELNQPKISLSTNHSFFTRKLCMFMGDFKENFLGPLSVSS